MNQSWFRFYGPLNDFLPGEQRFQQIEHQFLDRASIKDMIEAIGVPHPEIEFILVNGVPSDFSHIVVAGDYISVYPHFFAIQIPEQFRLTPAMPPFLKFVLDVHLGKLAQYLRMLGCDTLYANDCDDPTLEALSASQQRILLTRDRGLLKRNKVVYGYYIRNIAPWYQLQEVWHRFALTDRIAPFTRCLLCNQPLQPASKEAVLDKLPEKVRVCCQRFYRCSHCDKIYWQGSHWQQMQEFIARFIEQQGQNCTATQSLPGGGASYGITPLLLL